MAKYLQILQEFKENNALPRQAPDNAANRDAATSGIQHTNTTMCMVIALTAHEESFRDGDLQRDVYRACGLDTSQISSGGHPSCAHNIST
ncbi:hypothetical protein N7541_004742 [Penicillium brevicompactum]|uniref:Uncharacterized protein n=1 Tax=Penicillium brevicompactum TaxID=5074 RepID=A0A9W9RE24_PENBR|nr:hypothetical protein N7541_004742 [Penicillium brevicompactum]